MSSPTAPVHRTTTRFPTSHSTQMTTINGTDSKANRVSLRKPFSATGISHHCFPNNGSKSVNQLSKKVKSFKSLQENENSNSIQKSVNGHQINNRQTVESIRVPSPPTVFHAIAPAPVNGKMFHSSKTLSDQVEYDEQLTAEENRRIINVLSRTKIKTMSTAPVSSCSDEEGESSLHRSTNPTSSIDTEADESDHDAQQTNKQTVKSRRIQKTRKLSFSSTNGINTIHNVNSKSSTPPTSKSLMRKDDQHQSTSNDDEIQELQNDSIQNNRRLKSFPSKRKDRHHTTTTTTDDDTSRQRIHRYHPLQNLESQNSKNTSHENPRSESNCSSPIPTVPVLNNNNNSTRKFNRFQVKSIRKSQQNILLAHASAAKSSNDDDCSISNQRTKLPTKLSLIQRKHTNTPTTDGENNLSNTDQIVNGAVSALSTVKNGNDSATGHHRVRFHLNQQKKQESAAEEEKSTSTLVQTTTQPQPSSAASAQGEDEEEEEAIGKSPDNRFIKYATEIGRGAFKTVYRGLDTETSVAVAWCELQDFAQFDKHERARFKEEAEMLKKLKHQNIVRFYDFWEETNPRTNKKVIILVTELMTSGSLKGYIRNFKGQNEGKRINVMKKWCRQILKGLAYLHGRNPPVIHRDLKCDNVFISSTTGCVKIGDLGLATFKTQTFAKSMRGTMEFMAPEMFDEKYDELVDIYSFGLCMLEMITGEYPYLECKGPTAVIKRVTAGLKPDCYYRVESEDVREVIDCCIRTKKEERLPVNELLQHSFFLDDVGLRIDLVRDSSNDSTVVVKNDTIELKLKLTEKCKRKTLSTEQKNGSNTFEAILFRYNLKTDTPERIADELMEKSYTLEEEKNFVIQSIKDRLRSYNYEQLDRQAGVFCRDGRPTINQTTQSTTISQQPTVLQGQQQAAGAPVINPIPAAPIVPVNPPAVNPSAQQTSVDQLVLPKPNVEPTLVKPVVPTETTNVAAIPDLSANITGSAGSLEVLDAALKKTFNKNNINVSASANPATVINDSSEMTLTLTNQDENLITKQENPAPTFDPPQANTENVQTFPSDLPTNLTQISNTNIVPSQSQPSTMLNNQQTHITPNPMLVSQQSQSYSYSTIPTTSQIIASPILNETIKQVISTSVQNPSSTTDTNENTHASLSISPTLSTAVHSNENLPTSTASDATPQASGSSLQQLEVLLKNTFKKQGKTAGTAHSSDGEAANPVLNTMFSSLPLNGEDKVDCELTINDINPSINDEKRLSNIEPLTNLNQAQLIANLAESTNFDPLINTETNGSLQDLDSFLQVTSRSVSTTEETQRLSSQISVATDETIDLKSMLNELSRSLMTKMSAIEAKIDDHCQQTRKINQILTNTILPSMLDLTDIIQQSPNLTADGRIRARLEAIQTRIRSSQSPANETKDLMDI